MADAWAGAEVALVSLLSGLACIPDLEVSAILLNGGRVAAELTARGIPVAIIPESAHGPVAICRALARRLAEQPVQILHTHKYKDTVLGGLASLRAGVRHRVRTVHGAPEPFRGLAAVKMALYTRAEATVHRRLVHRLHAVSRELADRLAAVFGRDKVVCIGNGVDVEAIRLHPASPALRQRLGLSPETLVIGALGRLAPVKGFDIFIRAAQQIRTARPRTAFLLAGDGPLRASLEALAQELGLAGSLRFLGHRDDSLDLLALCDVVVVPSHHEGIPMVILEALAGGRPVVATRVGGVPDVIEDGRSGVLVAPADPDALARACLHLLAQPALARALGNAGRRRVQDHFSTAAAADRVADLYRALLGGTSAP